MPAEVIFKLNKNSKKIYLNEFIEKNSHILKNKFLENVQNTGKKKIFKKNLRDFFELNKFINDERASGSPLLNDHLLERNRRLSIPFSVLILTLLAVSVSSFKRRGGIGLNLAFGIALAFIFIFFDKFFSVLVVKSDFNAAFGAWAPNFVFLLITLQIMKIAKK